MGGGMGMCLAAAGHAVCGFDIDEARGRRWAGATGAPAAAHPAQIDWPGVDQVVIAVRLGHQVDAVLDLISASTSVDRPISVMVTTTLTPSEGKALGSRSGEPIRVFECPVSGGEQGAKEGTLTVLLAGPNPEPRDLDLLDALSARVISFEHYGTPSLVKLMNSALAALNARSLITVLHLAQEHGVPPHGLLELHNHASGRSWISEQFTSFPYDLVIKDLRLLEQSMPLPALLQPASIESELGTIPAMRAAIAKRGLS